MATDRASLSLFVAKPSDRSCACLLPVLWFRSSECLCESLAHAGFRRSVICQADSRTRKPLCPTCPRHLFCSSSSPVGWMGQFVCDWPAPRRKSWARLAFLTRGRARPSLLCLAPWAQSEVKKKRTVRGDTFSSLLAVVLFVGSRRRTLLWGGLKIRTTQAHAVASLTHQGDAGVVETVQSRNDRRRNIGFAKADTGEKPSSTRRP